MQYLGHVYRALTAPKNGPTVYDLCDPLLLGPGGGDAHLRKFYKTAIANPALRPLLSRAGLPQLRDPAQFNALRDAIVAANREITISKPSVNAIMSHRLSSKRWNKCPLFAHRMPQI